MKMRAVASYDILVIVTVCHIAKRHVLENRNLNPHLRLSYLVQDAEFRCKFSDKVDLQFNLRVICICLCRHRCKS
jgi:hypothetical protein